MTLIREALSYTLIAFLVFGAPLLGRRAMEKLKNSTHPLRRVKAYQKTVISQAILCLAIFGLVDGTRGWPLLFRSPAGPGAGFGPIGIGASVGLLLGYGLQILLVRKNPNYKEAIDKQIQAMSYILPQTDLEKRWWLLLCLAVGFGEELIFRGFLIRFWLENPGFGVLVATLIAALIFGLNHAYQGLKGIVLTFIFALLFSVMFFASGALWLPMAMHTILDGRFLLLKTDVDR